MKQNVNILLKKHGKIGLVEHEDPQLLINYSNNLQDVYKDMEH